MKFVPPIMDMLQDGKKSEGTDNLWDVFMSFCEEGKAVIDCNINYY